MNEEVQIKSFSAKENKNFSPLSTSTNENYQSVLIEMEMTDDSKINAVVTTQRIGDNLEIDKIEVDNAGVILNVRSIVEDDDGNRKISTVLLKNGEPFFNQEIEGASLPSIDLLNGFNSEEFLTEGLPCISNGCCPGYRWCGKGCGSGTPVNGLDYCCRAHDRCYGVSGRYPGRCSCDRELIRCASSQPYTVLKPLLISAFGAVMLANGC